MKRLIVLAVAVALLINFLWFLLSLWPYQRLAKLDTARNAKGQTVRIESSINKEIYKSNVKTYVTINVGTLVLGISASLLVGKRR